MNKMSKGVVSLQFGNVQTYIFAALFAVGNLWLPQLFHFIPGGGMTWLPIYFFTLVGACKYGWRVGLLTAVLSPILNTLIFGMPSESALPMIVFKSVALAVIASCAMKLTKSVSVLMLLGVVLAYQTVGLLGDWVVTGDLSQAFTSFHRGVPGMILQVIGVYAVIRYLLNR